MNKNLLLFVISCFLLTCDLCAAMKPTQLESIVKAAPWEYDMEPYPLPRNWQKHKAEQCMIFDYAGGKVIISAGDTYFTYQGKVAIGWHGSYNPPCGM